MKFKVGDRLVYKPDPDYKDIVILKVYKDQGFYEIEFRAPNGAKTITTCSRKFIEGEQLILETPAYRVLFGDSSG